MDNQGAYRILVNGIVQGVGFRPFIYNLAVRDQLTGWVRNTSGGVEIEICGPEAKLDQFLASIRTEAPPLAKVESIQHQIIPPDNYQEFQILHSQIVEGAYQPISPDVSICRDCLEELFSPDDFRYRYPFINCTNCGPRFTIIKDIPYDRPQTTMAEFELCPVCHAEYQDPLNRRFHAQPVACPACGPEVWLKPSRGNDWPEIHGDQAIDKTQELLANGNIAAIKGLGGFHLACNAQDPTVIEKLRTRKHRPSKPLAVMMPDLETVRKYCLVNEAEAQLLVSPQRPILLLDRRAGSSLPDGIAPGQNKIGVMLPYTPLHYLLFAQEDQFPQAPYSILVMTSANLRGNPILIDNHQVQNELDQIADFYLLHNRDIYIQCDDSVLNTVPGSDGKDWQPYPVRRSRGYTPQPIISPLDGGSLLAVGAELKNTFCHLKDRNLFPSQHLGDLKNLSTLESFQRSVEHFETLFRIQPALLVHDAHPDYLSTRYALERAEHDDLACLSVQHHHAHIASCLADNRDPGREPVIGLAFDGVGYGDDGAVWGGEIMVADYSSYQRLGHLEYFPLPGGDLAIREPWRCSLGLLDQLGIAWEDDLPPVAYAQNLPELVPGAQPLQTLKGQIAAGTNTPLTSSLGRLFDAVASLAGIRHTISYEGQAAIELEALADPDEPGCYPVEISEENLLSPAPIVQGVIQDLRKGTPIPVISARFHNTLAELVLESANRIKSSHQLGRVALSGGVWQNISLLAKSCTLLSHAGFEVLIHRQVPPNDGGLSLGQAVIGQSYLLLEE